MCGWLGAASLPSFPAEPPSEVIQHLAAFCTVRLDLKVIAGAPSKQDQSAVPWHFFSFAKMRLCCPPSPLGCCIEFAHPLQQRPTAAVFFFIPFWVTYPRFVPRQPDNTDDISALRHFGSKLQFFFRMPRHAAIVTLRRLRISVKYVDEMIKNKRNERGLYRF